jgi:hypothetical protein
VERRARAGGVRLVRGGDAGAGGGGGWEGLVLSYRL